MKNGEKKYTHIPGSNIRDLDNKRGCCCGNRNVNRVYYADDMILIVETDDDLQCLLFLLYKPWLNFKIKPCPGLGLLGGTKHFCMATKNEHCSGWQSTAWTEKNILKKVKDLIKSDHYLMVRMTAYELILNHQIVCEILLYDLNICKICAKIVPRNLTQEQKNNKKMCV